MSTFLGFRGPAWLTSIEECGVQVIALEGRHSKDALPATLQAKNGRNTVTLGGGIYSSSAVALGQASFSVSEEAID